jgi:hypothetical protein
MEGVFQVQYAGDTSGDMRAVKAALSVRVKAILILALGIDKERGLPFFLAVQMKTLNQTLFIREEGMLRLEEIT